MNEAERNSDYIEIDLREYIRIVSKWKKLIILGTLACMVTAAILSFFVLPPVFEAQSLLLVTQATDKPQVVAQNTSDLEGVVSTVSRLPVMTMNTYLGQLKSQVLMKRVINELKLDSNLYTPESLAEMIDATVVKDSNLIQVKVRNNDPKLAASIANELDRQFLRLISEKNEEQMARSVEFLTEQRKAAEAELAKATQALKTFEEQPRGVAVLEDEFKKRSDALSTLQTRYASARVELRQLEAGVKRLEDELKTLSSTIMVHKQDPITGKLVEAQEINPIYVSTAQQLAQKRAELAEKQAEIESIEEMLATNRTELDALQAELAGKRLEQDRLMSEVDRLKKTTETLAQKATETQITKSIDLGDTTVVVVSEAAPPLEPVKPNKKLNIAVAFILGLVVFTVLALLLENLDSTIKNPDDVENYLGLPVLGLIPQTQQGSR